METKEPLMLNISQAAKLLSISAVTMRKYSRLGRIPPPVFIGKRPKWSRPVLERWVAEGCPPMTQKPRRRIGTFPKKKAKNRKPRP